MYYTISDLFDDEELALILDSLYAEELCADDETLRAKLSSVSKKVSSLIREEYEIESIEAVSYTHLTLPTMFEV